MKSTWKRNFVVSALFLIGCSSAYANQNGIKLPNNKSKIISALPIFEMNNGTLISKIHNGNKSTYSYDDFGLKKIERSDGVNIQYFYHRDGKLDRAVLSNGNIHTAQYDEQGNLFSLVSTSGRALKISINSIDGIKVQKMAAQDFISSKKAVKSYKDVEAKTDNKISSLEVAEAPPQSDPQSLDPLLLAIEGWDIGLPGTDDCSGEQPDPEHTAPGTDSFSNTKAAPVTGEETPPKTDCIVIVISGSGGGGTGGIGVGGNFNPNLGGVIGAGTIVIGAATLPPGTAPSDSPMRARCMAAAYKSWEIMEAGCSALPIFYERSVCKEANRRLYNDEIALCNGIP